MSPMVSVLAFLGTDNDDVVLSSFRRTINPFANVCGWWCIAKVPSADTNP